MGNAHDGNHVDMDGVEVVNFDFCAFGMQTVDNQGRVGLARKRTKVTTNSKHVAEALRHHQCNTNMWS
jgi:hypothetical protein